MVRLLVSMLIGALAAAVIVWLLILGWEIGLSQGLSFAWSRWRRRIHIHPFLQRQLWSENLDVLFCRVSFLALSLAYDSRFPAAG